MNPSRPVFPVIVAAAERLDAIDRPTVTAARLARLEHARLHIVHAVTAVGGEAARLRRDDQPHRSAGIPSLPIKARHLAFLYTDDCPGLTVEDITIASGVAWEAIFKNSVRLDSRLIVLGPHMEVPGTRRPTQAQGLLGSTADGVIRHARCPVMIVNRPFPAGELRFRKIVVGIDFSRPCVSALCLAALLGSHRDSRIHPFHMLPVPPYPKYSRQAFKSDCRRTEKRIAKLCHRLLPEQPCRIHVGSGTIPHASLLLHVRETAADLIIVGSHTREKTGKWYPGSVVRELGARAPCPVMVVNGPEALGHWKNDPRVSASAAMHISPLTLYPD
jgi:nucleotide-binding universal stress UspA family protein